MGRNFLIKWHSATHQKGGNSPTENEDQYSPPLVNGAVSRTEWFRCAMSDGATQSSFSQLWAKLLANQFVNSPKNTVLTNVISEAKKIWHTEVISHDLSWAAKEKLHQGSHATLLGLEFESFGPFSDNKNGNGRWSAISVGDTCLFQYRKELLINSVPAKCPEEFSNRPHLVSTRDHPKPLNEIIVSGTWNSGDDFFLMTDALADWAFRNNKLRNNVPGIIKDKWTRKTKLNPFADWIELLRSKREIKNDDTTVIWIKIY